MNHLKLFGRIALAASLTAGVGATAQAQASLVTPADIQQAWVGKKVFARSASGALMDFYLKADGSAAVAGPNFSDVGSWRLNDTGYCVTWSKLRAGKEGCFTVSRDGSTTKVLNSDQSVNAEILRVVE